MKKLKIVFIPFYFYPDISAISQLFSDYIKVLAENKNYEITVLSSTTKYVKVSNENLAKIFPENVNIKKVKTTSFGKRNIITRLLDYLAYYIYIFFHFLFANKYDLIISLTQPPMLPYILSVALMFKKTKYIYYIQDLYPELLFDFKIIKNPWLIRKLKYLNQIAINRANHIITIGDYMKNKVKLTYKVINKKISVIHNWPNEIEYISVIKKSKFELLYSGNIGVPHDLSLMKLLINNLKFENDIYYHFIGGGKRQNEIENIFEDTKEKRVLFEGYSDKKEVSKNLGNADVLVLAQIKETIGDIVPSKFYSYLAAGRPMLFFGPKESEIGEIILKNDIGIVFEKETDSTNVYEYIKYLKIGHDLKEKIGKRAKKLYMKEFNLKKSVLGMDKIVTRLFVESKNEK